MPYLTCTLSLDTRGCASLYFYSIWMSLIPHILTSVGPIFSIFGDLINSTNRSHYSICFSLTAKLLTSRITSERGSRFRGLPVLIPSLFLKWALFLFHTVLQNTSRIRSLILCSKCKILSICLIFNSVYCVFCVTEVLIFNYQSL